MTVKSSEVCVCACACAFACGGGKLDITPDIFETFLFFMLYFTLSLWIYLD